MTNSNTRGLLIGLISLLAIFGIPEIAGDAVAKLGMASIIGVLQFFLIRTWLQTGQNTSSAQVQDANKESDRIKRESASTKKALEEVKEKLVKSSTTMASLAAIAKITGESLDLNKVLSRIIETVGSIGANKASIWLLEDNGKLKIASQTGWKEAETDIELTMGEGIIGWVAQHARPVDQATARQDPSLLDVKKRSKQSSILAIPLVNNNETMGVLNLGEVDRRRIKDEGLAEEKRMLHFLAGLAAMSIKNAKVFGATKEFAEKDVMTGLYNHRYYQDTMDREMKRSDRYGDPLSVVLTDIDKFKSFNDTYGHQVGDQVLEATAHIMADLARDSDIACRYGGEEFVLILPQTGKQGAALVAERLRKSVADAIFDTTKGKLRVTLSAGVSTFPEDSRKKDVLVRLCDEALYRAKEAGRNRVELAWPEGAAGPPGEAPAPAPAPNAAPVAAPAAATPNNVAAQQEKLARAQHAAVARAKALAAAGDNKGAREAAALAKAINTKRTQVMAAIAADPNLAAKAKAAARIAAARRQGQGQDPATRAAKARQTATQGSIPDPGPQGS